MQRYDWPRHLATLASPKSDTLVSFWKSLRAKQDLHTDTLSLDSFGYFLDFTMDSFWISVKNAQEAAYEKVGWVLSLIIINLSSAQWFWLWCFSLNLKSISIQSTRVLILTFWLFSWRKLPNLPWTWSQPSQDDSPGMFRPQTWASRWAEFSKHSFHGFAIRGSNLPNFFSWAKSQKVKLTFCGFCRFHVEVFTFKLGFKVGTLRRRSNLLLAAWLAGLPARASLQPATGRRLHGSSRLFVSDRFWLFCSRLRAFTVWMGRF